MTRSLPLVWLLAAGSVSPWSYMRYQRTVTVTRSGQNCLVLDAAVYTHAAATFADLRLVTRDSLHEVPFQLLENGSAQTGSETARILNPKQAGRAISFDLAMPARAYTDVDLQLETHSLLAHASVSAGRSLGEFTLFDLSSQHLPKDTTLHLQESSEPLLHVTLTPLAGSAALTPAMLTGATVPPAREAQTLYTAVLSKSELEQTPHATAVRFLLPAHLPIERVGVTLKAGRSPDFSRSVRVISQPAGEAESAGEQLSGSIGRLHSSHNGVRLDFDQLSLPATLGANLQRPAEVQVAIENSDQPALPIATVALETRQREICFQATAGVPLMLLYGDPKLEPPQDDAALQLQPGAAPARAELGSEQQNPGFSPRARTNFLTRRHPRSVYLGLMLGVCVVGVLLLRSKKLRL